MRLRSTGGKFSEFVIAADLRPIDQVAAEKTGSSENCHVVCIAEHLMVCY